MRVRFTRIGVALAIGALAPASAAGVLAATAPPMMTAHTGAKLSVSLPRPGQVVTGNVVTTRATLRNFDVDCAFAGTANRPGIGHYHIELDGSLINMFCRPTAQVSLLGVQPGKHALEIIPAANDHADDMKAMKTVSFVYRPTKPQPLPQPARFAGKPQVRVLSPRNGATVTGGFDMKVAFSNFRPSCALYGKANVAGYGHWHVNVDTTKLGMMGMATMLGMSCGKSFHVSLAGIKPGTHKFFAILEDDTHAPTIGVQTAVTLNVK